MSPNAPIEVSSEATLMVLLSRRGSLESTCDDLATSVDVSEAGERSGPGTACLNCVHRSERQVLTHSEFITHIEKVPKHLSLNCVPASRSGEREVRAVESPEIWDLRMIFDHVIRMTTSGFHKPPSQRSHKRQGSPVKCSLSESESVSDHPNVWCCCSFTCHCHCHFHTHVTLHLALHLPNRLKKKLLRAPKPTNNDWSIPNGPPSTPPGQPCRPQSSCSLI